MTKKCWKHDRTFDLKKPSWLPQHPKHFHQYHFVEPSDGAHLWKTSCRCPWKIGSEQSLLDNLQRERRTVSRFSARETRGIRFRGNAVCACYLSALACATGIWNDCICHDFNLCFLKCGSWFLKLPISTKNSRCVVLSLSFIFSPAAIEALIYAQMFFDNPQPHLYHKLIQINKKHVILYARTLDQARSN
jgi:hypothetical protein